jgi:hypothetical protein
MRHSMCDILEEGEVSSNASNTAPDWAILTDGARVRLLIRQGAHSRWRELPWMERARLKIPAPRDAALCSDAALNTVSMRELGAWAEHHARLGRFRNLLLVATPHLLKNLHAALGETARRRLSATKAIDVADLQHWGAAQDHVRS